MSNKKDLKIAKDFTRHAIIEILSDLHMSLSFNDLVDMLEMKFCLLKTKLWKHISTFTFQHQLSKLIDNEFIDFDMKCHDDKGNYFVRQSSFVIAEKGKHYLEFVIINKK